MCEGGGSSHSYSPLWGWAKPYPETTGYLIPTLLAWAQRSGAEALLQRAEAFAQWLMALQHAEGWWAGGVVGGNRPSVFNTAMIVDGLSAYSAMQGGNADALESARRGWHWLMAITEPDGAWRRGSYVPGYTPSYYAYAVAAAWRTADRLNTGHTFEVLRQALRFYATYLRSDGTLACAGLKPGAWAFTHTIAYALQGLWEAASYAEEADIARRVAAACRALSEVILQRGFIAGRYRDAWRGDYTFTSPVGNAQLSVLLRTVGAQIGDAALVRCADLALAEALKHQCWKANPNVRGALPGSAPFWGPYMRWRYPNWGAKFLLDALYAALS